MEEIKDKKIFILIIIFIVYGLVALGYKIMGFNMLSNSEGQIGLEMFYRINGYSLFLPFYLLLSFLINNVITINYHKNKYTTFQNFIIERKTYKERYKYEVKSILIVSFCFRLFIHVVTFLIINFCFCKIGLIMTKDPSYYIDGVFAYSSNSLISFIIYVIYSCIGFSILSLFLYILIPFIKNLYVYKISGLLVGVLGTMLPALIGNIYISHFGYNMLGQIVTNLFYSGGLISPGIESFVGVTTILQRHIMFYLACLGYISLIGIFGFIKYKRERKNG